MNPLLKSVAKRFFFGNPVKIGINFEGQGLTDSNLYKLGCKAGPGSESIQIDNLFHEMCHLAEREKDKLIEKPHSSWGFTFGSYWEVPGIASGWEPKTEQSVLREARVWSYQLSLSREMGLDPDVTDLVGSAIYIPAFCYFQYKRVSKNLGYRESENAAVDMLAKLVEEQTKIYSFERFEEAWNERMEIIHC